MARPGRGAATGNVRHPGAACKASHGALRPTPVDAERVAAYFASNRPSLPSHPHPDPMQQRTDLEALLRENLGWIDRVAGSLCRRHGLAGDEVDDVTGWVRMRLVENDYAILGKFRGESAVTTYLTVVVSMLFRDYRVSRWGRWRPSAAARRLGDVAVRLETLVYRDGYRVDQAGELLRSGGHTDLADGELVRLLAQLPVRTPTRPVEVGDEPLATHAGGDGADDRVRRDEAREERMQAEQALRQALDSLPPEDRVIVKMRIWEDLSVADISRALHLPQKPLYRRLERIFGRLRSGVEDAGITRDHVRRMLDEWAA